MKLSKSYFFTLREDVKDDDSLSGKLLTRAGYVRRNSSGIYMYLPLGWKVMMNIEGIVREEMERIGCQEMLMPALIPEEFYIASGRRKGFGSDMFTLKDRNGKPYALGPTHEELFALAAAQAITSYKDMPFSLYQLQTKFRDEPRPRFGLIRVREFIMHDAYTFDKDEAGLDAAYQKMFDAYVRCMQRFHLHYVVVTADTGVMGGSLSQEFQALSETGEDTLACCDSCGYGSNLEVAPCPDDYPDDTSEMLEKAKKSTPGAGTIEEVSSLLHKNPSDFVKCLIYLVDGRPVAAMVRGNRDVNETKLKKHFHAASVQLADAETVEKVTGARVGFAGPIGLSIPVVCDYEVSHMKNFIVGANETDAHYTNVNMRDFPCELMDLRQVQESDKCPACGGKLVFRKGIEVANPFKLGTKYAEAMNLYYSDAANEKHPVYMGSYGLGVGRVMAAVVEQSHDEQGIIWPMSLAPYKAAIVVIDTRDKEAMETGNTLYDQLRRKGIDTILDDRDQRPGVKFKDMDLIGIPIRITIGRALKDGCVECKMRTESASTLVRVEDAADTVQKKIREEC